MFPVEVGGLEPQAFYPTSGAKAGVAGHQGQNSLQSMSRQVARVAQRAADVLMVDSSVDECDHAAEAGGEALWPQMPVEELLQLIGGFTGEFGYPDVVGVYESAFDDARGNAEEAQFFVADDMGDNVFDGPAGAETLGLPILRCQGLQVSGEVLSLLVSEVNQ